MRVPYFSCCSLLSFILFLIHIRLSINSSIPCFFHLILPLSFFPCFRSTVLNWWLPSFTSFLPFLSFLPLLRPMSCHFSLNPFLPFVLTPSYYSFYSLLSYLSILFIVTLSSTKQIWSFLDATKCSTSVLSVS